MFMPLQLGGSHYSFDLGLINKKRLTMDKIKDTKGKPQPMDEDQAMIILLSYYMPEIKHSLARIADSMEGMDRTLKDLKELLNN